MFALGVLTGKMRRVKGQRQTLHSNWLSLSDMCRYNYTSTPGFIWRTQLQTV